MNELFASLFEACAAAPGALGCGVCLPNHARCVRSYHQDCTNASLEKTLLDLSGAVALLAGHDLTGHRLAWTFATGKIFLATRPDGALFCLVTRAKADAGEFFDQMTAQFLDAA